jgi:hypothetical protein
MVPLVFLVLLQVTPREPADLIVHGRLFTGERDAEWAEALAIQGNEIVAVGTRAEVERWRGSATEFVDAGAHTVMAGFNDAHCHFDVVYGMDLGCDLSGARSLAEIQEGLRAYAALHPGPSAIRGSGWDLADLPAGTLPNAVQLDEVSRGRAIVLSSEGPHCLWVNSKALEEMRLPPVDVPGQRIHRDEAGKPTGFFVGRGLFALAPHDELPTLEEVERGLERGFAEALQAGVTTVHDPVAPFLLPLLAERCDAEALTLRFHVWGWLSGPGAGPAATRLLEQQYAREGWITFGTLKGGLDGMPGLRTAAVLEAYANDPGNLGLMTEDPAELAKRVEAANAAGFRVALHATGDAAVRAALDAFAVSRARHPGIENRIEHAFYVHPDDRPRFAALGVIASVQPGFLVRDLEKQRFHEAWLGAERLKIAFPMRSLLDAGATLALGTDCSLTPLDPLYGLRAAVTRQTAAGAPTGGWLPAERISLAEALRAYTLGSARAEGQAARKGTLAPGKLADLVAFSDDVFALPPERLREVRVDLTIVDGMVRWRRAR